MKFFLLELLRYSYAANELVLNKLTETAAINPKALRLMAHILNAQQLWLQRIKGGKQAAPWEERELEELRPLMDKDFKEWTEMLEELQPEDLLNSVSYTNTKGEKYENILQEIIYHVINHGTHHRGQINALLAEAGETPPVLDYIMYKRQR